MITRTAEPAELCRARRFSAGSAVIVLSEERGDMLATVVVALLLFVAIGASVQMVHLAGLAPLLVTCAVLVIVIGQSVRARS